MNHRKSILGFLTLVSLLALSASSFAAQGYTQTAETYPPPADCPPMCGPMTCIICTTTGTVAPQQIAQEVSLLVPVTNPPTVYGIVARDGLGAPIIMPGGDALRFDLCETCPGPVESPAPSGFMWVNFISQEMTTADGVFQYVPHPTGLPGTALPAMFWVSDTGDDLYGNDVTNLLSLYPQGTVSADESSVSEVKSMFR